MTAELADYGIGYTLATGRLFCDISDFHAFAEELLARPVFTHEFGDTATWDDLRAAFELRASATMNSGADAPSKEGTPS